MELVKNLSEDCGWPSIGHVYSSGSITVARRTEYYLRLDHVPSPTVTGGLFYYQKEWEKE